MVAKQLQPIAIIVNQQLMDIKEIFWNDIASRLNEEYTLKSHPSTWKKGEVIIFLEHFKNEVIKFRAANGLSHDLDIKISYDTFRRVLIKNETKGSDYTRNIFAQYFGEPTYLDYTSKLKQEPVSNPKFRKTIIASIGLILLLLSIASYSSLTQNSEEDTCENLKSTIRNAIHAEFSAYKSVPEYDQALKKVEEYFIASDHAYKKIEQILVNEKKRKWTLSNNNNISSAELIDVTCEFIDEDIATLRSKEHWVIQWFDTQTQEYSYLYDTINTQIYYLRKSENDKWKISINNYGKRKDRIYVKIFDDNDFTESITLDELKRKVINYMSNGDNQNAIWWMSKYAQLKSLPILEEIIVLQGTVNNNIRRVNTSEISISQYYKQNIDIDHKILDVLNKFVSKETPSI